MDGGCLCGAVRYTITGEPSTGGVCHCRTCQRVSSAPRLPFVGVPADDFAFTKGMPAVYRSSPGVSRSFCGLCGSPLTYRRDDAPAELDVMTISLDDPGALPPAFHVWVSEAVSWDSLAGDLPSFARSRKASDKAG